jgi:hypothetical protein
MSQSETLEILKGLGGRGKVRDIKQKAKEMYPQYSLYKYIGNQLTRLRVKGDVSYDPVSREWTLVSN